MSKRIFKAMMAVTLTTLLVCMALFIAILFPYFETQLSDELMNELWQSDEFVDDNTLTVNVNRLRKKLEGLGAAGFLTTRRGQGYQL